MKKEIIMNYLVKKQDYIFVDAESNDKIVVALLEKSDDLIGALERIPYKNPTTVQLIAFFFGSLGVDRLYLGDIKNAILKYFTLGGLGIWWIKDIASAKKRCRAYNLGKLLEVIDNPELAAEMQQKHAQRKKLLSATWQIGGAVAKGVKDIGDTMYVD